MLRIVVVLALLAGFALSPKLWLSSRFYPLTPVWPLVRGFGYPGDSIVLFALIALLIAICFVSRREIFGAAFALLLLLALQDQSRWQPWFYQYVLMLLAIGLAGRKGDAAARQTCCLIVAFIYIWSGLGKLNPNFAGVIFPALIAPFVGAKVAYANRFVHGLALAAPFLECAAGAGLLTRRFRRPALFCAIGMHMFILLAIGPLGTRSNSIVWPWNLAMIAFLLILFSRPAQRMPGQSFPFQKVIVVLVIGMPALSFFNLWDQYLSASLYSGNRCSGVIYFDDAVFDQLPEQIQDYVTDEGPNRSGLDIHEWSLAELNVASYPEVRIYRNVARRICAYVPAGSSMELVVQEKRALMNGGRRLVYGCRELE